MRPSAPVWASTVRAFAASRYRCWRSRDRPGLYLGNGVVLGQTHVEVGTGAPVNASRRMPDDLAMRAIVTALWLSRSIRCETERHRRLRAWRRPRPGELGNQGFVTQQRRSGRDVADLLAGQPMLMSMIWAPWSALEARGPVPSSVAIRSRDLDRDRAACCCGRCGDGSAVAYSNVFEVTISRPRALAPCAGELAERLVGDVRHATNRLFRNVKLG